MRPITIKQSKVKEKVRILKASREKKVVTHKDILLNYTMSNHWGVTPEINIIVYSIVIEKLKNDLN